MLHCIEFSLAIVCMEMNKQTVLLVRPVTRSDGYALTYSTVMWCTSQCDAHRKPFHFITTKRPGTYTENRTTDKQKLAGWILFITSKVSCCVGST